MSNAGGLGLSRAACCRYVGGALVSFSLLALSESHVQALIKETPAPPLHTVGSRDANLGDMGRDVGQSKAAIASLSIDEPEQSKRASGGVHGASFLTSPNDHSSKSERSPSRPSSVYHHTPSGSGSERANTQIKTLYPIGTISNGNEWFAPAFGRDREFVRSIPASVNRRESFDQRTISLAANVEPAFDQSGLILPIPIIAEVDAEKTALVEFEIPSERINLSRPGLLDDSLAAEAAASVAPSPEPIEIALDISEQLLSDIAIDGIGLETTSPGPFVSPAFKASMETLDPQGLPTRTLQQNLDQASDFSTFFGEAGLQGASSGLTPNTENLATGLLTVQAVGGGGAAPATNDAAAERSGWRLRAEASAGYDTNPFFLALEETAAPAISLRVIPEFSSSSSRTDIVIAGGVEWIEYLDRYDTIRNYNASGDIRHRASERLELVGGFRFFSRVVGTAFGSTGQDSGGSSLFPDDTLPNEDITLLGLRQRANTFAGTGSMIFTPSERDRLEIEAEVRREDIENNLLNDVTLAAQRIQYRRVLNESIQIGAEISYSIADFDSPDQADADTISPSLVVNAKLAPRWDLTANVGAGFVDLDGPAGNTSDTAFTGQASLCYRDNRKDFCATATRGFLPFGVGGVRLQSVVSATYSHRLSARDRLSFSSDYSSVSEPTQGLGSDVEAFGISGRYDRQINERVDLFFNATYSDFDNNVLTDQSRSQILGGFSIRLGAPR
ncbi:MAG: hypothetical protein AAFR64_10030 [Pseudomonadota bacterium]